MRNKSDRQECRNDVLEDGEDFVVFEGVGIVGSEGPEDWDLGVGVVTGEDPERHHDRHVQDEPDTVLEEKILPALFAGESSGPELVLLGVRFSVDQLDILGDVGNTNRVQTCSDEEVIVSPRYQAFIEKELQSQPDDDNGAVDPDAVLFFFLISSWF